MTTSLFVLAGMLVALGGVALVAAWRRSPPRLADALDRLELGGPSPAAGDLGDGRTRTERLGAFAYRHVPQRLSDRQRQALRLQGRSIADHYGDKAALAIAGALLPAVVSLALAVLFGISPLVPAVLAVVGAVGGFLLPDLLLRQAHQQARTSAVEALLVFIDLVTLERLANASATQALHNAAQLSDAPLFVQMRLALERARLEQHSPYGDLRRMADEMNLPELNDVADVMQLDESGAALSGALRARVRELRDAHLSSEQVRASADAEGMTLYMTLPAVIFGAIFMGAAVLKIATS